jgi:hypothetical protein
MSATGNGEDKVTAYIGHINRHILPHVDFSRLNASYASQDKGYAKQMLASLHQAFVQTYGGIDINEYTCGESIMAPAVIRARNTGELCVGLVTLDLTSSGEHWGTDFFAEHGVIPDDTVDRGELRSRIDRFIPYDYWYTVRIESDIHVDFGKVPQDVAELLHSSDTAPVIGPPPRKQTRTKTPNKGGRAK